MSLLARSVATLEGIALTADPNYQMVAQVSRPVLPASAYVPCTTLSAPRHRRVDASTFAAHRAHLLSVWKPCCAALTPTWCPCVVLAPCLLPCRYAQAYPFVARKVLRDDGSGTAALLRDLVYDEQGRLRPGRLSALLQAALGYVSEQTEGFVDFDSVPAEGASVSEVLAFVLSPEARELRPLLVGWLSGAADLLLRDRSRKAAAALPGLLTPRLPFAALLGLPSLPSPPPPPVFIPGESQGHLHAGCKATAES